MKALRLMLTLVIGGGLGLLAVPLLPQQGQDWVTAWQTKVPSLADQVQETFSSRFTRDIGAPTPSKVTTPTPKASATVSKNNVVALRNHMLELINTDRKAAGVPTVVLGDNSAAQARAEEMLHHSYLSHWGLDGLKPYMRYTLAGGEDYSSENALGITSPLIQGVKYQRVDPLQELREAEEGFMSSSGHRTTLLDKWSTTVNLGIACNEYTCAVVQQFEREYINLTKPPTLANGILTMAGTTLGGMAFESVQVWYDQPPHPLTISQVKATYAYSVGQTPAAFIRKPPGEGSYYAESSSMYTWDSPLDPYRLDPETGACKNLLPGGQLSCGPTVLGKSVPWITATTWKTSATAFAVTAN